MELLLVLICAHFIGDIALQTQWLADNKGKDRFVMFLHVAVYMSVLVLAAIFYGEPLNTWVILALFVTHFLIDEAKARHKSIKMWEDQLMHLVTICITYLFFSEL
ncbi:MAG: DUF3307 domain-containing protein [Patescibacteria group bacterium]|nr:DUF3307 domain-containing protein [Patescibacteria group bacterium]